MGASHKPRRHVRSWSSLVRFSFHLTDRHDLCFHSGLIDAESHGNVILDPKVIALRYLKSWFAIDFVSSLPLDYVFLGLEGQSYSAGRALRILRLAKLLQLLRLLRISRLVRYVRLWQEVITLPSIRSRSHDIYIILM